MKEVPLFQFEGKTFDVSFQDNIVQLYAVKDLISGVMVSSLIPAANDYVAVQGFKNFKDKKTEEKDVNVYQLVRIGALDTQAIKLADGEREVLFDTRDDLEKFLEEGKNFLIAQEE